MIIDSYNKFKEYCLRRLGKPVIEIEMDDDQIKDRIYDAIQMFSQRHYDGVEEVWKRHYITADEWTNKYLQLTGIGGVTEIMTPGGKSNTKENVEVMDDLDYHFYEEYAAQNFGPGSGGGYGGYLQDWYITQEFLATMKFMMRPINSFRYNEMTGRLYLDSGFERFSSVFAYPDYNDAGWTTSNCTITHANAAVPNGDLTASTLTADSTANFSLSYTYETDSYVRGVYTIVFGLHAGTYTGRIKITATDRNGASMGTKTFTTKSYWKNYTLEVEGKDGHINDLVVTVETVDTPNIGETILVSTSYFGRNASIFVHGYAIPEPDEFDSIWNVHWIKEYATALLRRQWGHNLNKYDGILLPGGVTLKGSDLINEAQTAIDKLEEELEYKYSYPADMMIG